MTIHSSDFLAEINAVDNTKTLTFKSLGSPEATGYKELEFSYQDLGGGNYQVVGGSDYACNYGCARLLWDMGYRFIGHTETWIRRPSTIPLGLFLNKTTNAIKTPVHGLTDNFNWVGLYLSYRTTERNLYFHWRKVLGAELSPWPHGHKWQDLINTCVSYFDDPSNTALTKLLFRPANGTYERTLALEEAVGNATNWGKLVDIAANYLAPLCAADPNFAAPFDPLDGSPETVTSDLVVAYCEAVVAKIRAGAPAIAGFFPARTAVPLAKLGILAYAEHAAPPTNMMTDGIYVQVTSNYLFSGLSQYETIKQWRAKSVNPVTSYVYPDLNLYHHGQVMVNKHCRSNGWDLFDLANLDGFFTEYGPACLPNAAMMNWLVMRTFFAGVTYEDALADLMAKRFNNDPAVLALYRLWGRDDTQYFYNQVSPYALKKSFDLVYAMQAGADKTLFKQYLTFVARFQRLPPMTPVNSAYQTQIDQLCSNVMALKETGMIHHWSWMYRDGGTTLYGAGYDTWITTTGPGIWTERANPPSWYVNPVAPNDADFDAEYALLVASASRNANLEDNDNPANLVLFTGRPLVATGSNPVKNSQRIQGPTRVAVVGPATLTLASQDPLVEDEVVAYPAGITLRSVSKTPGIVTDFVATVSGGALFVDGSKAPNRNGGTGRSFLDIQDSAAGIADMDSSGSSNFYDESGQYILYNNKGDPARQAPNNLGPGVIAHDDGQPAVGKVLIGNTIPWFSNDPELGLWTKALAQSEFPGLVKIKLV